MTQIGKAITAKCAVNGPFVIKLRRTGDTWEAYDTQAIGSAPPSSGGTDQISSLPPMSSTYPGCPHCRSPKYFACFGCFTVTCWDGVTNVVTCAGCGAVSPMGPVRPIDLPTKPWQ